MGLNPAKKRTLERREREARLREAEEEAQAARALQSSPPPPLSHPPPAAAASSQINSVPVAIRRRNERSEDKEKQETRTAAAARNEDGGWSDPDTASIASRDSEDLYARRPNRWRGQPRAWRHITEHDRAVVAALWRTRDRDLSAHLYNAFYIKKQGEESANTSEAWTPGNYWTAWPLRLHDGLDVFDNSNFAEDLLDGDGGDGDDKDNDRDKIDNDDDSSLWTFRSRHPPVEMRPSGPLEEMLTATIQRVAREQLHERLQRENNNFDDQTAVVSADDELATHLLHPSVRHVLAQMDKVLSILHNSRVVMGGDFAAETQTMTSLRRQRSPSVERGVGGSGGMRRSGWRLPKPSTKRTCARPSHWTPGPPLMIATARTPGEVTASIPKFYGVAEDITTTAAATVSQSQSQAKTKTAMLSRSRKLAAVEVPKNTPRGRPPKRRERLPGETEKQFLIRLARQAHRRIPEFSDDEDSKPEKGREEVEVVLDNYSKGKIPAVVTFVPPPIPQLLQRRVSFANEVQSIPNWIKNVAASGGHSDDDDYDDEDEEEGESDEEREERQPRSHKKKNQQSSSSKGGPSDSTVAGWPLRNWKDVLGAAALSGGFSPEVLARTAQRCADLFGQSTALSTMHGVPGPADKSQTLQEKQQQLQGHKRKQPLSVDNTIFAPKAGAATLPAITPQPKGPLSLQTLTVEVQRAQAERQDRMARKQAFLTQILGQAMPDVEIKMEDEEDGLLDDEDSDASDSEASDDEGDGDDDTKSQPRTPSRSKSRSMSRSMSAIPPPPVPISIGTASTAPQGITLKPRAKPGPPPKATPTMWYCPRPNCPRALDGFPRRPNMVRHLKLVHGLTLDSSKPNTPSQA
ncbi:hypothetical protein SBRCBS47491_001520 [Sporothrix bragantina]|uniref:Rrn9 domain-containing protein n=1 Tax=Sporothrix bragantina TaxID=671064 RepID=A0ABP0AZG1_9PEZI